MERPFQILRSKTGTTRGECVALLDEDYVHSTIELFQQSDPEYMYWAEPFTSLDQTKQWVPPTWQGPYPRRPPRAA